MYELELGKAIEHIKNAGAKKVCIQLPEGLKPKAKEIVDRIQKETKAKCIIWMGSCFGACDVPELGDKADMLIQFGHTKYKK